MISVVIPRPSVVPICRALPSKRLKLLNDSVSSVAVSCFRRILGQISEAVFNEIDWAASGQGEDLSDSFLGLATPRHLTCCFYVSFFEKNSIKQRFSGSVVLGEKSVATLSNSVVTFGRAGLSYLPWAGLGGLAQQDQRAYVAQRIDAAIEQARSHRQRRCAA